MSDDKMTSNSTNENQSKDNRVLATERRMLLLSFTSGVVFVIVEVIFAWMSNSQSALMDAAYDSTELIVIITTLFLTPLFHKPTTEKRPFGYAQVESMFTAVKSIMMISVMLGLSANVVQTALAGGAHVNYGAISLFQFILAMVSVVILLVMYSWNRKASSPTVRAEVLGWKLDATYSMGLSIAFFLAKILESTPIGWLAPYFDQIVALMVVVFSLPDAIQLLRESVSDMFLFAPEKETTEQIGQICDNVLESYEIMPTSYEITRTGRRIWIAVYFETENGIIVIESLKKASKEIEKQLEEVIGGCTCEFIPAIAEE